MLRLEKSNIIFLLLAIYLIVIALKIHLIPYGIAAD